MLVSVLAFIFTLALFQSWRGALVAFGAVVAAGYLFNSVFKIPVFELQAFFVFGTIAFWALAIAAVITMVSLIEYERESTATITLLVFLFALQFFGNIKVFTMIFQRPYLLAPFLFVYFICGLIWAGGKIYLDGREKHEKCEELMVGFLTARKIDPSTKPMPDYLRAEWAVHLYEHGLPERFLIRNYKNRILFWMMHWPWHFGWSLLKDPVRRLFEALYRLTADYLQKIADYAYNRHHEGDLPTEAEREAYRNRGSSGAGRSR